LRKADVQAHANVINFEIFLLKARVKRYEEPHAKFGHPEVLRKELDLLLEARVKFDDLETLHKDLDHLQAKYASCMDFSLHLASKSFNNAIDQVELTCDVKVPREKLCYDFDVKDGKLVLYLTIDLYCIFLQPVHLF
jgi:hypothetical protein